MFTNDPVAAAFGSAIGFFSRLKGGVESAQEMKHKMIKTQKERVIFNQ